MDEEGTLRGRVALVELPEVDGLGAEDADLVSDAESAAQSNLSV